MTPVPGFHHVEVWIDDLAGSRSAVDAIMTDASAHGWQPLYQERYPHAGGPDHYAGWLVNASGFKVEVVADADGR
ncbi:MAG: hypothetical protein M3Y46_01820 [Actinomycetota bacterium]|nr:hypothetical protein [Actinomycetota bacterium]